jgi:DNA-binding transcriptional MerR regulator
MMTEHLRTSDIAKAVGVHPNTVRLYEAWGLLPPIPRTLSGYRKFDQTHLDQMKLARAAMRFTMLGGEIRKTAYDMVYRGAKGDLGGALELAYQLRVLIQAERAQAEAAADFLEAWAAGAPVDATEKYLRIGQVAGLLEVSIDQLRNWERNGLIEVLRDPHNGYRRYRALEIGRLRIIRTLVQARYSQMAILRMMIRFDRGETGSLRQALDTPRDDEDVYYITDHWLSTLADLEQKSQEVIALLNETLVRQR